MLRTRLAGGVIRGATLCLASTLLLAPVVLPGAAFGQPAPATPPAAGAPGAAPSAPGAAPPAWQQGRPADLATSPLQPNPPRLTGTPVDRIPVAQLRVPQGFHAELWASGMPGARMMARSPGGTLFVGTRTIGRVYAVTEQNGQRRVHTIAQGLTEPNGVAFRDGALYVAAINRVLRYDNIDANLEHPPQPVDLTQAFDLPTDAHHGWKFLRFGPDGKLYMQVGANCNICRVDDRHAVILRYNPDGTGREVMAYGVRNSVGFDWNPVTNDLWFTNNGRDWAGENAPEDMLGRITAPGQHFGFPFCHMGTMQDPEITGRQCSEFQPYQLRLGPHTAALGMRFYTGSMFPAEYRNNIFIARHGSWNRTERIAYDVVRVSFNANGEPRMEPFLTGLLDSANNRYLGRPTDVEQLPDGSLLVSDEENGAIYRITYRQ